jgi:hypothetical protein
MAVTYSADRAERILRQWTQAAVDPGLTDQEIEDLLWSARIADVSGYDVDAVLWTPTYGNAPLRSAAAEGWRLKAAKLTTEYDVAVGSGTDFKRKQQYDMCLSMVQQFTGSGGLYAVAVTTDAYLDV